MVVSLKFAFINLYGKTDGCAILKGENRAGKGLSPEGREWDAKK
jgi:hypothetical protein